jgi:hypothetical protein
MNTRFSMLLIFGLMASVSVNAQEIQTIFGKGSTTGGYLAMSNKFTTIGERYANISEIYGGVFINKRWMIGFGVAGTTNDIRVPQQYSVAPLQPMTYQYGQGGMMVERVIRSGRAVHVVFNVFGGAGFTAQYNRYDWNTDANRPTTYDENWFYVLEPGAQLEMNLFRWMRLSPGVSYRHTYGSNAAGLSDDDLSNWSYNITLKIGGFGKAFNRHSHRHHDSQAIEN